MTRKEFQKYLVLTVGSLKSNAELLHVIATSKILRHEQKQKMNILKNNIDSFIKAFDKDLEDDPESGEKYWVGLWRIEWNFNKRTGWKLKK